MHSVDVPERPADWDRLARYVIARRNDLGLSQAGVAQRGGPSVATLVKIEGAHGQAYKDWMLAKLEKALGWRAGTVQSILGGGQPRMERRHDDEGRDDDMPDPLGELPPEPAGLEALSDRLEAAVREIGFAQQLLKRIRTDERNGP